MGKRGRPWGSKGSGPVNVGNLGTATRVRLTEKLRGELDVLAKKYETSNSVLIRVALRAMIAADTLVNEEGE